MYEFDIQLGETYYNEGFINVRKEFSDNFGEHNSYIKVQLNDGKTIFGKIDRNANENSSPRIRFQGDFHHEYVKWINQNFNLNDVLKIKHNSKYCLYFFK